MIFNTSEEWIQERIVEPWERGDDLVLDGQHWPPNQARVTVIEASEMAEDIPPSLEAWNTLITASGKDRTNHFLTRPAGSARVAVATEPGAAADTRKVMVVHGRDGSARRAMFEFLRAIGLWPLEWTELVGAANAGAPYIGEVLDAAFSEAQAVVVLSTPDDVARLRHDLLPEGDREGEGALRGQARPNVFFEAGMAIGRFPNRTILTELGDLRPASDLGGRHAVRLNDGPECRHDLANRLRTAGCAVNAVGTDWISAGDFAPRNADPSLNDDDLTVNSASALIRRAEALRTDLGDRREFVTWGVAVTYNALLDEADDTDLPRAVPREPTEAERLMSEPTRARMTADEMRSHLGQLLARLA
jgi:predicted nucleotide-binding protein